MVELIKHTPRISVRDIADHLGYDPSAVGGMLTRMQEQGEARSVVVGDTQLWSIISERERDQRRLEELEAALAAPHTGAPKADEAGTLDRVPALD